MLYVSADDGGPLVTVYIPTHNRVVLLKRAVESVLSQDYQRLELIVVSDNSSDGTNEYLEELVLVDTRVRFFSNYENLGACASRNIAIFAAEGEFITGLDDDDYFEVGRISSFVKNWHDEDGVLALYTDSIIKSALGVRRLAARPSSVFKEDLLVSNYIGNQIFTRRYFLTSIGGFKVGLVAWQDLDCWYRLLSPVGSCAKKISTYNYVVDQSHPHERISSKSIDKIYNALECFVVTNGLSEREKLILSTQVFAYNPGSYGLRFILMSYLRVRNFKALIQMFKVYASFLINSR